MIDHTILTDLQHGFRSGRSCKIQLVIFQDLAQINKLVKLTSPLLTRYTYKIIYILMVCLVNSSTTAYMIKFGYKCITFFKNMKQSVVVNGKQSSLIDMVSGVSQGTVFVMYPI